MGQIVFWQSIVSPHMFSLAVAMHENGDKVTCIVEELMSENRAKMGWDTTNSTDVKIILFEDKDHIRRLVEDFPPETIHIVQGVYANHVMEEVRRALKKRSARWGAIMETIDERSWNWPLKRLVYWSRLSRWFARPDFILAIGAKTPDWVSARGFSADLCFPFSYFIPASLNDKLETQDKERPFRIGFVGQLIPRKRLDLLIDALAGLPTHDFELVIIGDGSLSDQMESEAKSKLGESKVTMFGRLPMKEVASKMGSLDCFVLPSDHDGWGVVVTEALMAGVPAITSDACGSSVAVMASGVGGVFPKGDAVALRSLLKQVMERGAPTPLEREQLTEWAKCFGAEAGAKYLSEIFSSIYGDGARPEPPWSGQYHK